MSEISRTVSTALQNLRQRELASRLTAEIADVSQEATTGLKANPYKDLGLRASDAIAIRMQIERNDGFRTSNKLLDSRLELLETSLAGIRDAGQEVLNIAALSAEGFEATAGNLAQVARSALNGIVTQASVRVDGAFLLSGTRSDVAPLQKWGTPHPDTGLAPRQIIDDITGGQIGDLADAQAKIADLKAVFDGTDTANPARNFEQSFYNGTPELDANGQPSEFVSSRISETELLDQRARGNDPAMRDLLRGLSMLSSVEIHKITDPAAYKAWVGEAVTALSEGLGGINDHQVETGIKRGRLDALMEAQDNRSRFLDSQQFELEGVDQFDAAGRLTLLQTQLEVSYTITSRMSRMSFLNFL